MWISDPTFVSLDQARFFQECRRDYFKIQSLLQLLSWSGRTWNEKVRERAVKLHTPWWSSDARVWVMMGWSRFSVLTFTSTHRFPSYAGGARAGSLWNGDGVFPAASSALKSRGHQIQLAMYGSDSIKSKFSGTDKIQPLLEGRHCAETCSAS